MSKSHEFFWDLEECAWTRCAQALQSERLEPVGQIPAQQAAVAQDGEVDVRSG
jgi:hypothetical protein